MQMWYTEMLLESYTVQYVAQPNTVKFMIIFMLLQQFTANH